MSPSCDLVLDPVTTTGVLSAKLWIRRGSSADPLGQKGGHQLLSSVLSRGCGPVDHLQLADLVEGCGAGLRCDTHEDGILISLKCRDSDADRLLPALGCSKNPFSLAKIVADGGKSLNFLAIFATGAGRR